MIGELDVVTFLAGLGFFLLGMERLETSLGALLGRRLRTWLRGPTRRPAQGVLIGTLATAILQSSSLVTLMLMAFVGAGVLSLTNAVGVMLGANLGTTLTGWLVATIGFKLDLASAALPLIALGAMGSIFISAERQLGRLAGLLLGLGFLLFGLEFMKASASEFADSFDPAFLQQQNRFVYLLVGLGFTIIVQSSSAAMMVNLTALSTGVITLENAAALAIGADLGTTITAVLGSLKGSAAKRRVALAHVTFNVYVETIAFILLGPLLAFIAWLGLRDPLYSLVAFHSLFNFIGILAFLPFVPRFSRWLERRFVGHRQTLSAFISPAELPVPDAALTALQRETAHLCYRVMLYRQGAIDRQPAFGDPVLWEALSRDRERRPSSLPGSLAQQYDQLKELEGEILLFCRALHRESLTVPEAEHFSAMQNAARHAVRAAKALKDIEHNLSNFEKQDFEIHARTLESASRQLHEMDAAIVELAGVCQAASRMALLAELAHRNSSRYAEAERTIYRDDLPLDDIDLSTLLNVEREIYSSNAELIDALEGLLLPVADAESLQVLKPS